MDKELKDALMLAARENGGRHGKLAELDFGAGAEWMYKKLKAHNSDKMICPKGSERKLYYPLSTSGESASGYCDKRKGNGYSV